MSEGNQIKPVMDRAYFAETDFRGKKTPFAIKALDRLRHVYVIGKTGMGKSTMLENLAIQDIQSGNGIAILDPHGSTAEKLLDYVPPERVKDVVYFDPSDLANPISFNVLEDVGKDQRYLVVSGLMSAFKKIWVDAWSARMEYILQNTLLALLEYPGSTLLGVNRVLSDKDYRKKVTENVTDPGVRSFWFDEFAKYTERMAAEAVPAIQNKVGQFTSNPLIRNIIGQPKSSFSFRDIMDNKKILIMNLSKGKMGEGNANLIGSMLITKIYLTAMSRANISAVDLAKAPPFYFFVDEFQSFANESFANILSEARKYKLSLTIAHQYIEQMSEEVRAAVFGNVGTLIAFRVGPFDAEVLEKVFSPTFVQEDLVNLGFAQVYLTLMIDGVGSPPFSAVTLPPIPQLEGGSQKEEIINWSRQQFAKPRATVEAEIKTWHENALVKVATTKTSTPTQTKSAATTSAPRSPAVAPPARPAAPLSSAFKSTSSSPPAPTRINASTSRNLSLSQLKPRPHRDDIKTVDSKQELRKSLQNLLKSVPAPTSPTTTPTQSSILPPISTRPPAPPPPTAQVTKPKTPELPKQELEAMLRID